MSTFSNRRDFLHRLVCCGTATLGFHGAKPLLVATEKEPPKVPDHTLTTISGKPRTRGKQYGQQFKDDIHAFLEKEIYRACAGHASRDVLLRYAGPCVRAVKEYAPAILDEMEGMAEGAGLKLEEMVLLTLHEETAGHKGGVLPPVSHCTALAAGPPHTRDGNSYVGQNWDWMDSVYGLSRMLLWKRPEGPSVLAYSYPGLWIGAGLNSAGVALCWTWGDGRGIKGPRVGIPSYVLIAQMLYQETLEEALKEARRARHAGWFAFVLGDGKGRLATVEGTPEKLVVQQMRGHTARASYACREILGGPAEKPLTVHPQCQRMFDLLEGRKGQLDRKTLEGFFADHGSGICKHPGHKGGFTVDSMLFNCTTKEAHLSRGPGCSGRWKTFRFD
jgi:isopenicillin-N N-acyltransferase-like protein